MILNFIVTVMVVFGVIMLSLVMIASMYIEVLEYDEDQIKYGRLDD